MKHFNFRNFLAWTPVYTEDLRRPTATLFQFTRWAVRRYDKCYLFALLLSIHPIRPTNTFYSPENGPYSHTSILPFFAPPGYRYRWRGRVKGARAPLPPSSSTHSVHYVTRSPNLRDAPRDVTSTNVSQHQHTHTNTYAPANTHTNKPRSPSVKWLCLVSRLAPVTLTQLDNSALPTLETQDENNSNYHTPDSSTAQVEKLSVSILSPLRHVC